MLSNSVGSSCSREGNPAVFVNVFPVVVISPLRTSTLLIEVLYPRPGEQSPKATPVPPESGCQYYYGLAESQALSVAYVDTNSLGCSP